MSSRAFVLITAVLLSIAGGLPGRAETAAPPAATATPAQPATPPTSLLPDAEKPSRSLVTYGPFTIQADQIGLNLHSSTVSANGHVEMRGKNEVLFATKATFDRKANTGSLENVTGKREPFTFEAELLTIDQQDMKRMHHAAITTCSKEHPHYRVLSRELSLSPDDSYTARGSRLELNGTKYFYLPYIRGSFSDEETYFYPSMRIGKTRVDGFFYGTEYQYPLGNSGMVGSLEARLGTKGVLRGGAFVNQPFALGKGFLKGNLSLGATYRSDVENSMLRIDSSVDPTLKYLTVSRLPTLQIDVDPFKLPQGFALRVGTSVGRFQEHPTGVTENRAQGWGIVTSPSLRLGPADLYGEYGFRRAVYQDHESMNTSVWQVTLETRAPAKNFYYNLSYLRRNTRGSTPFLFDNVLIPEELYGEVELPLTRTGNWRLDVFNRYDLQENKFRSTGITLAYSLDCMSYGLIYNPTAQSFGFGIVINAFDSFRHGVRNLAFPQ